MINLFVDWGTLICECLKSSRSNHFDTYFKNVQNRYARPVTTMDIKECRNYRLHNIAFVNKEVWGLL